MLTHFVPRFLKHPPSLRSFGRVLVIAVLIFTLAVPVSLSLAPQRAEASAITGMVWECCANLFTNIITTIKNVMKVLKEFGLDTVAWVIAQKLIQKITKDLVKWAQRGFDGAPAFATDFEGLLLDTVNAVAGDYILGRRELAWLCSPYSFNIRFTLAIQVQQFRDRTPRCTLTGVIDRFDDFLEGDFLSGGWAGWFQLTQQPTNNIYGSFLTARSGLNSQISSAKERKTNLLDWGHGFLGWTECPSGTNKVKQGQTETCVGGDADGNEIKMDPITQTPGKVIEKQLNDVLPEGRKKLVTADEINEIIGAIASTLISQLFESAGGLFKADSRRPGRSTSILDQLRGERPEDFQTQKTPNEGTIREDIDQQFSEEQSRFRYSLTPENSLIRINPGGLRSTNITKTLLEGSARATSLTVSNASALSAQGITFSGSNISCFPTCTVRGDISTASTTPIGRYPITITGDPAPDGGSITVNLEVTLDADTTPPAISAVSLLNMGAEIEATVSVTDDFGVARTEAFARRLGGAITSATVTDTAAPYVLLVPLPSDAGEGDTIEVVVTAFDAAGNNSISVASIVLPVPSDGGGE